MITERVEIGVIALMADGQIQIRTDTILERDGVEISRQYAREILDPATSDVSQKDTRIRKMVEIFWTPEVRRARAVERAKPENIGTPNGPPAETIPR